MPIETDALIVGAGPAGLFQAFQLGLLEIKSHIVDALPYPGGQCIELYPDKPIYDIPGVPLYSGRELVANLLKQLAPFKPNFHLGQVVTGLESRPDGRFFLTTSTGSTFLVRCVMLAAGVGAFQPKLLGLEGVEKFRNRQLFYHPEPDNAFLGSHLVIVGGDDSALELAIRLCGQSPERPASITLLHRREVFQAAPDAVAQIKALCNAGAMRFLVGQATGFVEENDKLVALQVVDALGQVQRVTLNALLVCLGLSPKLGPITGWGLAMERKQLVVDTEKFATATPGIFAIGDVNTYPGKKKLILSAFHEAALAAFGAAELVFPGKKPQLQYTTTSSRLHALLGVAGLDASGELTAPDLL